MNSDSSKHIYNMEKMHWESDFFRKNFGFIDLSELKTCNEKQLADELTHFLDTNRKIYDIIQTSVNQNTHPFISFLIQEFGFKWVETRVTFRTKIIKTQSNINKNIRFATKQDLPDILNLTHESFTNNDAFYSRFKNRMYFKYDDTKRYYEAWINNNIQKDNCVFLVFTEETKIIAYSFFVKDKSEYPAYRVGLTAIAEIFRDRGLYKQLIDGVINSISFKEFFLINVTQLNNIAMLRSYIKNGFTLQSLDHIFYYTEK